MEEDFFKVGYTPYLQKQKNNKERWTSRVIKTILKHKIITWTCIIILMCTLINFWLIYKFVNILNM